MRVYGFTFIAILLSVTFYSTSNLDGVSSSNGEINLSQNADTKAVISSVLAEQQVELKQKAHNPVDNGNKVRNSVRQNIFTNVKAHSLFLSQKDPIDELTEDHGVFLIDLRLVEDQDQVYLVETQFDKETRDNLSTRIAMGDQLIVKFSENISDSEMQDFMRDYKLNFLRQSEIDNVIIFAMRSRKIADIKDLKSRITHDPKVSYVAYNDLIYTASLPNDPNINLQWAVNNMGLDAPNNFSSLVGAMRGFDSGVVDFWKYNVDCRSTPIAIIDTGIDVNNVELTDQIDFLNARNFGSGGEKDIQDTIGHGTHVAGIIGARGSNFLGISGVCQTASLIPIKLGDGSTFTSEMLGNALKYASQTPAKIVNVSLLLESDNPFINEGILSLERKGKLVVASAGNSGKSIDQINVSPAGNPSDYIISVAASSYNGELASFSNFGVKNVDIAAPGDLILSLGITGNGSSVAYSTLSGTSQAAPYVAGALALVWSYMPDFTTALDVKKILMQSARRVKAFDQIAQARVLDLSRVIEYIVPRVEFAEAASSQHIEADGSMLISFNSLPSFSSASTYKLVFSENSHKPKYSPAYNGFIIRADKIDLPLSFVIKAIDDYGYAGESQEITIHDRGDGQLIYSVKEKIDRLRQVACELKLVDDDVVSKLYSEFVNDRAECLIRCQSLIANSLRIQTRPICNADDDIIDLGHSI
jgi:subtilisin family serine protease